MARKSKIDARVFPEQIKLTPRDIAIRFETGSGSKVVPVSTSSTPTTVRYLRADKAIELAILFLKQEQGD